ncbi:MAG: NAD+ synthase [Marinilabiliales bacterium]|nr:MAG: NAD+ synthase [Marinilabiliales bacterium]
MKIAFAQLNYHIGNLESNSAKIIDAIERSKKQSADLVIFSELSLCGYSPHDLLEHQDFIDKCKDYTSIIAKHTQNIGVIIGVPTLNPNPKGKNLYNSAVFIADGKIQETFNKTLLPTYDIFDEYRHFEPNETFKLLEYKGKRIAVTICEDLWDEQRTYGNFSKEMLYKNSPLEHLSKMNPDFVINISASPYSYNQASNRKDILINNAKKYSLPIIYVNQTGANTDLIFDGGSLVINKHGETVFEGNYFKEDFAIIKSDEISTSETIKCTERNKYADIYNALVLGIRDYFYKSGFKKAVLGLSGGVDSALTLAIAVGALCAENVTAILMPSAYSSSHSIDDAIDMAQRCKIDHHTISIEESRLRFEETMSSVFKGTKAGIAEENIQARLRGSILMAYYNKFGCILLNTSNKSEAAVGYSTLYGDMNGALYVLGDVYKTDVYKLCHYINKNIADIIPENTITKPPSAELRPDQKDNDSLPEYDILDKILFGYIEQMLPAAEIEKIVPDRETIDFVIKMVNRTEYKRYQSPPILRISSKSFGFGRRMPIVAKF